MPAFGQFVLGAQASGTQVKARWLAISNDGSRVNIGQPLAVGVPHRMAHVMTKLRRLAT